MKRHDWGDLLFLVFLLAVVLILVRPSSYAPAMISSLGDAFASIVGFVSDSGLSSGVATQAGQGIGALA